MNNCIVDDYLELHPARNVSIDIFGRGCDICIVGTHWVIVPELSRKNEKTKKKKKELLFWNYGEM